jgi:catechol 2,3-dioxygenase-like lactoylglutathione lyase family enzyme
MTVVGAGLSSRYCADMLSNARVAPTLAVTDLDRARRFYEDTLGLKVEAEVAETIRFSCGNGTGLALFERPMEPIDRTVAAFEVDDLENEVAQLRNRGVEVEGISTVPGGVKRAFFKDPDGNIIGMRQL